MMTPEEQRIAIAEACGWINQGRAKGVMALEHRWIRKPDGGSPVVVDTDELPDYLNDLNAMHEAEKTLTLDLQRTRFLQYLIPEEDLSPENDATNGNVWTICHAAAAQRAKAFLRTIGEQVG